MLNSKFNRHHERAKQIIEQIEKHIQVPDSTPDDLDYLIDEGEVKSFDEWSKQLGRLVESLYNETENIQKISNKLDIALYNSRRTDDPIELEDGWRVGQ